MNGEAKGKKKDLDDWIEITKIAMYMVGKQKDSYEHEGNMHTVFTAPLKVAIETNLLTFNVCEPKFFRICRTRDHDEEGPKVLENI